MNLDEISADVVTVAAIAAVAYLGYVGVTDPFVLSIIAGLGGYRAASKRNRTQTSTANS